MTQSLSSVAASFQAGLTPPPKKEATLPGLKWACGLIAGIAVVAAGMVVDAKSHFATDAAFTGNFPDNANAATYVGNDVIPEGFVALPAEGDWAGLVYSPVTDSPVIAAGVEALATPSAMMTAAGQYANLWKIQVYFGAMDDPSLVMNSNTRENVYVDPAGWHVVDRHGERLGPDVSERPLPAQEIAITDLTFKAAAALADFAGSTDATPLSAKPEFAAVFLSLEPDVIRTFSDRTLSRQEARANFFTAYAARMLEGTPAFNNKLSQLTPAELAKVDAIARPYFDKAFPAGQQAPLGGSLASVAAEVPRPAPKSPAPAAAAPGRTTQGSPQTR